ncbi:hypothetical protein QQS21_005050 [Conoideocrella luteorostrata]|uniref:Meiotic recombination protein DMC1 n=1 Tax=Conoideocrella luteorostrata TaxID=1105319 RepID=A0AAJ0FUU4_9HYPO|nr:hypothetical protein QQS21_005050 [Conoideocrella luteorostrata]
MDEHSIPGPGGFLPQTYLPSPSPSSTSSRATTTLPHPRNQSLRPGSNKEDLVRRYVEEKLLNVSRRYVKKFGNPNPGDTVIGFKSAGEVSRELEGVVNILWKSGTPSDFTQYVRSFPPSPRATFELLRKLDHCFASLLCGQDIETKETLPGFENGLRSGMTTTDMVRCRSLVEQTRVLIVEVLRNGDVDEEESDDDEEEDSSAGEERGYGDEAGFRWDVDEERMHMDTARIYENTIVQLGERLGDPLGNENKLDTSTVCST